MNSSWFLTQHPYCKNDGSGQFLNFFILVFFLSERLYSQPSRQRLPCLSVGESDLCRDFLLSGVLDRRATQTSSLADMFFDSGQYIGVDDNAAFTIRVCSH